MIKKRTFVTRNIPKKYAVQFRTLEEKVSFVSKCFELGVGYPSGSHTRYATDSWPTYKDLVLQSTPRKQSGFKILNTVAEVGLEYEIVSQDKFIEIITIRRIRNDISR